MHRARHTPCLMSPEPLALLLDFASGDAPNPLLDRELCSDFLRPHLIPGACFCCVLHKLRRSPNGAEDTEQNASRARSNSVTFARLIHIDQSDIAWRAITLKDCPEKSFFK